MCLGPEAFVQTNGRLTLVCVVEESSISYSLLRQGGDTFDDRIRKERPRVGDESTNCRPTVEGEPR